MSFKKALLIIDIQNDFCQGTTLAIKGGDTIIPTINQYIDFFVKKEFPVFSSRDWHPKDSKHFKDFGGIWPVHCVKDTKGAEFHPDLNLPEGTIVLSKGMAPDEEGYSDFESIDINGTAFQNILLDFKIEELCICGLATDYCVKATVLDALKFGFNVKLLVDAIKGVDLKKSDSDKAIAQMVAAGAEKATFEFLKEQE